MDFQEVMDFEEDDIGPMTCYSCGTSVGVRAQDVIRDLETLEGETLPVCAGCGNAISVILDLEDQNAEQAATIMELKEIVQVQDEVGAYLVGLVNDLQKRLEQGAGLNDVELTVLVSSDYEE